MLGGIIDDFDGDAQDAERALPLPAPGEGSIVQWSMSIHEYGLQHASHVHTPAVRNSDYRESCVALVNAWRKALQMRFERCQDISSWESVQAELNLHLKTLKPNFSNNSFLNCDVERVRAQVLQMDSWQLHRAVSKPCQEPSEAQTDTGVSSHRPR